MTRLKKLTALLVSAALTLSLLAGCGGSKALSQVIADLLSGMYNNVTVEVDPDLTAALKKAAAAGSTREEVLAALVEELNLSGVRLTLRQLQEGRQGDHGVELVFQSGTDPDAAARSAVNGWASAFGALPDDGSYSARVAMIEAEGGYYIAVDVEVLKAGTPDKDDPVTLTKIVLSGIYKTEYIVDETFDKTGLTVTAYYSNNTSKVVDNYSISPSGALTVQDDTVTITYEEYGQTASATISIAVTDPGFKMNGDTYEVYNADGLKAWAEAARAAIDKGETAVNCTLGSNITLTGNWTPVGDYSAPYTGTFDGGDCTISGLSISSSDEYAGLFGFVGSGGTVQNLTLDSSTITGSDNVGAVAGVNDGGTIENCHVVAGTVTNQIGSGIVGGVVGSNRGTVTGCSSSASVPLSHNAGGVVGINESSGKVIACYSTGAVNTTSGNAGGVVGSNSGTVTACYSAGTVTGKGLGDAGGVVGVNTRGGKVIACYSTSAVNTTSGNAGGVVGVNQYGGVVTGCYSTGTVTGKSLGDAGGVAGRNAGTVTACYSTGAVTGTGLSGAGGVAGRNTGTVKVCYWSGTGPTHGIGNPESDSNATKVDDNAVKWIEKVGETPSAMDAMNKELEGEGWQYIPGSDSPLALNLKKN